MPSENVPIQPEEIPALFAPLAQDLTSPCVLAVSGGSDSTALMVLLADWLGQRRLVCDACTVVTVDHGLRPESTGEARAVADRAAALGFRCVTLAWQGPKPRHGLQAAARLARYGLIRDYMGADNIGLLLTAHTRDDVAETLLMRLARGSGVDGLAAMAPRLRLSDLGLAGPADRFDPEIARPLLDTSKARLRATLEARGIPWIEDPSNQSPAFERSRLRAAQAGLDALGLNHAMLALSAKRLLRARRALEQIVDQFCAPAGGAVSVDPSGYFVIDLAKLQAAEAEIAVRVLARVVAVAGGSGEPVPLGKLEAVADALRRTKSEHPATTLARALITAKGGAVFVEREPGREPLPRILVGPGKQVCWDGRFLVGVGPHPAVGTVEVRPLGQAALAALRRQDALATRVSAAVTIPSFWRGETLIAAPSIGYWAAAELRRMLHAEFVGLPLGNRTSASP